MSRLRSFEELSPSEKEYETLLLRQRARRDARYYADQELAFRVSSRRYKNLRGFFDDEPTTPAFVAEWLYRELADLVAHEMPTKQEFEEEFYDVLSSYVSCGLLTWTDDGRLLFRLTSL